MSNTEDQKSTARLQPPEKPRAPSREDPLADTSRLLSSTIPPGVNRRSFLIRSAVGGAAAVMTGRSLSAEERTAMAIATLPQKAKGEPPPLSDDLDVVKKGKGPVLTTVDEFYKVGPGPSSSHTIGADAHYLRFLPAGHQAARRQTRQRTALKVNLFGSLSATGKGHGTERADSGRTGRERAGHRQSEIPGQFARPA